MTADFVTTLLSGLDNPSKLTITLTMAIQALNKQHSSMIILMADAVTLADPKTSLEISIGEPFSSVDVLMSEYLNLGGKVGVCKACLVNKGISPENIREHFDIITSNDVVDLLMNAKGSLQVS
ncbi:sulfur reduction protein DsrE [Neisseriaceae bacterium PsAf]|nr:sulfur reduction protein DsrE [Neisseriaceae bacterium PsAf]